MATEKSSALGGVALADLIALTDEMAALVRAGIPLEEGLTHVARDLARRPGRIALEMSQRMQAGESLLHVVSTSPQIFPPSYRAVVEAGLRSGRLPAALEGLASTSRRAAELGNLSRLAILYPVFIALLAYGLFVASLIWFQPLIKQTYTDMDAPVSSLNSFLIGLGKIPPPWFALIPVVGLTLLAVWWYRSSRSATHSTFWQKMTPMGRMIYYGRMATFADMLALMIENGTDLQRAVVLAAEASGDTQLKLHAHEVAADIQRGGNPGAPHNQPGNGAIQATAKSTETGAAAARAQSPEQSKKRGLPPLVNWLLAGGGNQPALAEGLRSTAATYRRSALRMDNWLRAYLPVGLTVVIGGMTVALYAVGMLGPWFEMLKKIASPR
ncbi:MAG TPA: type II secretion system F family protein [Pirellulales bacterium]|nr:type II secretion system F family protein [Pirellulales bacterium]